MSAEPDKTRGPYYIVALSASEKMALVDILGNYMRWDFLPQEFVNVTAPEGEPPVTPGFLLGTFLNLDPPNLTENDATEMAYLRGWQRNAIRAFYNMGEIAALMHKERKTLRAALLLAKGYHAHEPETLAAIEAALDEPPTKP